MTSSSDDDYYDLGSHHMPVTTNNSPAAQTWFDRGLIWSYGFNHEESVKCFEKAVAADPSCAMAYWGIAYSLGPNYNKPWDLFDDIELGTSVARAHQAAEHAQALAAQCSATPVEQALIKALQSRYPRTRPNPGEKCSVWNNDYAEAMRRAYQTFPDHADVAALYADALMNLTPWQLWDIKTGEPAAGARTLEAKDVLESGLSRAPQHPGLLHLYIHLTEMSNHPEQGLEAADRLRGLVPDAGHLQHMPSHLDVLCGDYARAITANGAAIAADERFLARAGPLNFYTLYRCHDYHFRVYAAMMSGASRVALDTAAKLERSLPPSLLRVTSPPMADWLEGFLSVRAHVLVRFGRWDDILALKLPPEQDRDLYCVTTATLHYAKGIALAVLGRFDEALEQRYAMCEAISRVPASRTLFNNTCRDILAVASAMLHGELAYRQALIILRCKETQGDDISKKGNEYICEAEIEAIFNLAFRDFREAVALDDGLPYDEPWGWMQPVRHALGALLLERGRVADAAAVYAADLGLDGGGDGDSMKPPSLPRALQHRDNVWALHGYHECLVRLGREAEAARDVEPRLRRALAVADVDIRASCFCRVECCGEDEEIFS